MLRSIVCCIGWEREIVLLPVWGSLGITTVQHWGDGILQCLTTLLYACSCTTEIPRTLHQEHFAMEMKRKLHVTCTAVLGDAYIHKCYVLHGAYVGIREGCIVGEPVGWIW